MEMSFQRLISADFVIPMTICGLSVDKHGFKNRISIERNIHSDSLALYRPSNKPALEWHNEMNGFHTATLSASRKQ